jgi:hypothetical protein
MAKVSDRPTISPSEYLFDKVVPFRGVRVHLYLRLARPSHLIFPSIDFDNIEIFQVPHPTGRLEQFRVRQTQA